MGYNVFFIHVAFAGDVILFCRRDVTKSNGSSNLKCIMYMISVIIVYSEPR